MPENLNLLRAFGGFFFIFWTAFNTALVDVVGSEQQIPLSVVKLWASAFGGEIKSIAAKYSGSQLLQKVLGKISYEVTGLARQLLLLDMLLSSAVIVSQISHLEKHLFVRISGS